VLSALSLPLQSLRCTRDLMAAENHPAPLLGFAAAPYTLLHYMVGGTTKNAGAGGAFCRAHPAQATRLLDALRGVVVEFLSLQLGAGADALQLFEAVAYTLTEEEHGRWAAPWMEGVAREVKARHGDKKLFGFQRGMPSGAGGMVAAG
jgi:uroporphyrinogen decarboxylase